MRLAVIEGLDGSGKSTQIGLLKQYLEDKGIKYKYLHFPRNDSPFYGELISRFLRGEFGSISQVDPYLVALIYAGDRNDAKSLINQWLEEGYFVLLDRYVNSNIAFQCAKLKSEEERGRLRDWILEFEYGYNRLPQPDINIFLNVPFGFTREKLAGERKGEDRDYLKGQSDIHEESLDFQEEVKKIYLSLGQQPASRIIDCSGEKGEMLEPSLIFKKIVKTIFNDENS